jgi:hypothetical protein
MKALIFVSFEKAHNNTNHYRTLEDLTSHDVSFVSTKILCSKLDTRINTNSQKESFVDPFAQSN